MFNSTKATPTDKNRLLAKAEEAAHRAVPRTYFLDHRSEEETFAGSVPNFKIIVIGDQGNFSEAQRKVAQQLIGLCKNPETKPDVIFIGGDNVYPFGVGSADDPAFNIYKELYGELQILGIPCIVILGNHDANLHKYSWLVNEQGMSRSLHQVAYTYFADINDEQQMEERIQLFAQERLILEDLPLWVMPAPASSFIRGNTEVFCIDSNSFLQDYCDFKAGINPSPKNQAEWLKEAYGKARAANRQTILFLHNPLELNGSRAEKSDLNIYFKNPEEKRRLLQRFPTLNAEYSLGDFIKEAFNIENMVFDVVFSGHEHGLSLNNNRLKTGEPLVKAQKQCSNDEIELQNLQPDKPYPLCQIISGGGGGGLQSRVNFRGQNSLGFFLARHGLVSVVCSEDNINMAFQTVDQQFHLQFDKHSNEPLRYFSADILPEKEEINQFCLAVCEALNRYFSFLNVEQKKRKGQFHAQNISHGHKGNKRAHEIWAYIHNYHADSFKTTVENLYRMARWEQNWIAKFFTKPTKHSFIVLLDEVLKNTYGNNQNLNSIYQQVCSQPKSEPCKNALELEETNKLSF